MHENNYTIYIILYAWCSGTFDGLSAGNWSMLCPDWDGTASCFCLQSDTYVCCFTYKSNYVS